MIDAIARPGSSAWLTTSAHTPRPAGERPAISIYQAPSQRVLDIDSVSFRTDRLIASLQNLALRVRAKEIVEGEPGPAPAPLVTSMSARAQVSVAATAAFRSSAPEYQVSVARMVGAPPPPTTEEPPPPTTEEPPPPTTEEPPPTTDEPPPPDDGGVLGGLLGG